MNKTFKILVTCPPMLGMLDELRIIFKTFGLLVTAPSVIQTLSVDELIKLVPDHDGWIIGDDPATYSVFEAGKKGKLRAAVKWGIGVDNVDFEACKEFGIPITNTPNMFGAEVADVAMGYLIALARETFQIDQGIRKGEWPKPKGISLSGKTVALIGYGDIGKHTTKRLIASGMKVIVYDPSAIIETKLANVEFEKWPNRLNEADFIVITCSLTESSYHMVNAKIFEKVKKGVRLINVGRGPVICEKDLEKALESGNVYSAALDVFEEEPLPLNSYLRNHPRIVLGSHNASNTVDAVFRTSQLAIEKLNHLLDGN